MCQRGALKVAITENYPQVLDGGHNWQMVRLPVGGRDKKDAAIGGVQGVSTYPKARLPSPKREDHFGLLWLDLQSERFQQLKALTDSLHEQIQVLSGVHLPGFQEIVRIHSDKVGDPLGAAFLREGTQ